MSNQSSATLFLRPTQILITWPDGKQEKVPLKIPATLIGRGDTNDIRVPNHFKSISRRHLEIRKDNSGYSLQDLGSANGVLLNGTRVNQGQLQDNDEFVIGLPEANEEIRFQFLLGSESLLGQMKVVSQPVSEPEIMTADAGAYPSLQLRWPNGQTSHHSIQEDRFLVGRAQEANLQIPEVYTFISANHFEIRRDEDRFTITDLNSTNGTYLNNRMLPPEVPTDLHHNAVLRIGDDDYGISLGITFLYPDEAVQPMDGFVISARPVVMDIEQPITIGRLPENQIHLDSPEISREHALIRQEGEHFFLEDLNSLNGTYVNEQLVQTEELFEGDLIRIGNFLLVFRDGQLTPYQSSGMRLDVSDLSLDIKDRRGRLRILDSIDLSILPREFVAIVGGSGAGKTTLLNALIGVRPGDGLVLLNGHDFYDEYENFRFQIGYVPQTDILHSSLTVEKALDFTARLRLPPGISAEERAERINTVLETVSMNSPLTRKNRISRLSGGQRKRVSIAAELIADPRLIYLDEATSGLDPGLEKKMMHTLRRMADEGRTVILITHATSNIIQADHVAFIAQGKLVFFGPSQEALEFFAVDEFADIYGKIEHSGDQWREIYEHEKPENYHRYVQARKESSTARPKLELPRQKFGLGGMLRQFLVLTHRSFNVLLSDPITLGLMLLLLPLTGVLQLIIGSRDILVGNPAILADPVAAAKLLQEAYIPFPRMNTFIFVMGLEAVLTGLFVPSNDLVKERPIFLRERMVNLKVTPYLLSKAAIYSVFVFIQVSLYLLILSLGVDFPAEGLYFNGPLELFITLYLTMMAGITFGFIISTVSRSTEMAIYMLTMMLFFQFFFAGTVFDLRGNTFEPLSYFTTTRWSLNALGVTIDLPEIVGSTILCSDLPENPLNPGSALQTVCAHFPNAVDDLMLNYNTEMLLISWGVLAGMALLYLAITGVLLARTRAY